MMSYKLANLKEGSCSYDRQQSESLNSSSHEWMLLKIRENFKSAKDKIAFSEKFRKLKSERIEADYRTKLFTGIEATECRDMADYLLAKLRQIF